MRMFALGVLGAVVATGAVATTPRVTLRTSDTTVVIRTFRFRPTEMVIPVGTRVIWTNADEIEHTVTAGVPDSAHAAFNGKLGTQGATFAHTFVRAGNYPYFCDRHPFMRGEIRVTPTGEK